MIEDYLKPENCMAELVSSNFSEKLLSWYHKNKRSLPWREDPTPYHVWISEIMLQQTRVEAVKGYYERFLDKLPDVKSLAEVDDEILHKLWEGLGYYNRAKNLKKAAIFIENELGGELPSTYEELIKLSGIGPYTAGAIASIAFHEPVSAIDGNVMRVIARLTGDSSDIGEKSTKNKMEGIVEKLIPKEEVHHFNQALMELGALVCIPNGKPKCELCPVKDLCCAFLYQKQGEFPVKKGKKERKKEKRTVFILENEKGEIYLRKRGEQGLLSGLWEFPSLEGNIDETRLKERLMEENIDFLKIRKLPKAKHIFSHIEWNMEGYFILCKAGRESRTSEFFSEEKGKSFVAEEKEYKTKKEVWETFSKIKEKYSIPSAFEKYKKWLEERDAVRNLLNLEK